MSEHSDVRYLRGLCAGERELIEEIYRLHSAHIRNWVLRNNGDGEDAKDLFNEAIMAIYDRYCGSDFVLTRSFGALLMAICRNQWFSQLRKKNVEQQVRSAEELRYTEEQDDADLLVLAEEAQTQHRRRQCMERTFQQLTERCRQVLTLLDGQGAPGEEVAQRLGISDRNAVYVRAYECRRRWRQLFSEQCNQKT